MSQASLPLVEADSLSKTFPPKGVFRRGRPVQAVRQIHARIARGEALGVVGESGSGKSTLGRMMLGLLPATSGSLRFDGKEMEDISRAEWRRLRRRMQIVFQDPFSSLDPRRRIGPQIADGMDIHGLASDAEQAQRVGELLARVGLDP
ncbi:ATP-binding cassette domain-containing protein, partial [Roseomonas sp. DSM 102946]|nr:ATP-binding cassette domain-containing protein [Roseomonas sp. DSM 102946]